MATRTLDSLYDPPLDIPLSYLLDDLLVHQLQPQGSELDGVSASPSQKRGRGRPPKPKPDFHMSRQFPTDLNNVPVPVVIVEHGQPAKRPRGRPRKYGYTAMSQALRQPGHRGRGRPRKLKPVSSLESVSPIGVNGPGKRGRPRIYNTGDVPVPAPVVTGEATAAVAPAKRRGRPPKIARVISVSHTGRPRGRPKKDASPAAEVPTGGAADHGALKRRYKFLVIAIKGSFDQQEKVVEATNKLKAAVSAMEEVQVIAAAMNTH